MRSLAETRGALEWALRAIGIAGLTALLVLSARESDSTRSTDVDTGSVGEELSRLTLASPPPGRIHARLASVPGPVSRDWLLALARAGSRVTWSGDLPAAAMAVRAIATPAGGFNVEIAAPVGQTVVLRDDASPIDSLSTRTPVSRIPVAALSGAAVAQIAGATLSASATDSAIVRRVLVLGSPSWETRFVVDALEEYGWQVDARFPVAPGVRITTSAAPPLDTGSYSAVVVLDASAAERSGEIARYVSRGGGVVMSAAAARAPAFADLRVSVSAPAAVAGGPAGDEVDLASLPFVPLTPRPGSVVLHTSGSSPAVAARRFGAGRVLQTGYADTWRWRMAGDSAAPRLHRLWWSGLVSSAAYAPRVRTSNVAAVPDEAPLASLVHALGQRSLPPELSSANTRAAPDFRWVFLIVTAAFLLEWVSRRLRGLR